MIVGIAGGSGSGKTTVARATVATAAVACSPMAFDNYYADQAHLCLSARHAVNYDHPDALDVDRFVADLASLRAGNDVLAPVYDFASHTRSDAVELIEARPLIVVDGILLLAFESVRQLLDVAVYVDVPDDLRTRRRVFRDVEERGRTADQSMDQIRSTVQPMHAQYVEPSARHADLVVDGTEDPSLSARRVVRAAGVDAVAGLDDARLTDVAQLPG